ncbi:type II secretion system F family protein [archaeon]|nr:type II secretion system F family protein [archaeon]
MDRKFLTQILIGGVVFLILSLFIHFYLSKKISYGSTLYLVSFLLTAAPIIITKYLENKRVKALEDSFPLFLRDFVESVRGGMPVPQALKSVSANDYGKLSVYVKKMAAQMDWGIPAEKVFRKFSKESKSRLIGRIISSVMESHKFGGNLADTFGALSETALEVDRLRAERRLYMNSQMITGYIIFFVFLGVIIGLEKFLVPSMSGMSPTGLSGLTATGEAVQGTSTAGAYKELFRNLVMIQGLFAGLTVGKMAEGAIVAGLKHSLFMMFVGMLVFTLVG